MQKFILSKDQEDFQCNYSFTPGQKMFFKAYFEHNLGKYHLRILDQLNNTRLNKYGKISAEGITLSWRIPNKIKNGHSGIWQIEMNMRDKIYRLFFFVKGT
ncbi:MAG: hypothetical protein ACTSPV_08360 [Candidatus Hodarchaeales archaeon]